MTKISNWEELSKLPPSKTHYLDVDSYYGKGWIRDLNNNSGIIYLSTHTFYNQRNVKNANNKLNKCGFDIELISWED